ncbi:MAG: NlpC/P60 family protein [Lachnospiraceae bacterium]|nr:NlpC/P60 family protein [Lachnospiraceae bacterium]
MAGKPYRLRFTEEEPAEERAEGKRVKRRTGKAASGYRTGEEKRAARAVKPYDRKATEHDVLEAEQSGRSTDNRRRVRQSAENPRSTGNSAKDVSGTKRTEKLYRKSETSKNYRKKLSFKETEAATKEPAGVSGNRYNSHRVRPTAVRAVNPASAATLITNPLTASAHGQVSRYEEDNVGVQAAHQTEMTAERAAGKVSHTVYAARRKDSEMAGKLVRNLEEEAASMSAAGEAGGRQEASINPLSRWRQKQEIKKEYAAARISSTESGHAATLSDTSGGAKRTVKETGGGILGKIRDAMENRGDFLKVILLFAFVMILLVTQVQACTVLATGMLDVISVTSWPAEDSEISRAEAYYTELEAGLQQEINRTEESYAGYDEYNYNLSEIGHDATALISYLCARYEAFTFEEVREELDALFALQYSLDVETAEETRTVTRTVQAGDYIGEVVTSGYCNCSICCGVWAGGPTASGVYPTAGHTLAVDASDPIVPIGTQIIMNGTLYTVEDTGSFARYGVDFDVYYGSHAEASAHGHQTWSAYYAGGDGEEIEVTTTETVQVCNVTLTAADFEEILTEHMTEEEAEVYSIYTETLGNRVVFGSPLDFNWHLFLTGGYGTRCEGTTLTESECLDVTVPSGTVVYSVLDGTVWSVSGNSIVLENDSGYVITMGGLANIQVSAGETVAQGDTLASVGSSGVLTLAISCNGASLHPYIYLEVGEHSLYGAAGDVSESASLLIAEAYTYLGVPYVWGGYSPSGFDCSGFVSYCINHCGGGWSVGRQRADGLLDLCTVISVSEAQPGDLVFFQGTYSTSGASHVGIYLGDGQMIHAGSPVKVSSINTSYWQSHFYCFGRLP